MNEEATEKYRKAFKVMAEEEFAFKKKKEYTEKRLNNVVKKKEAILKYTVPKYRELYAVARQCGVEEISEFVPSKREQYSLDELHLKKAGMLETGMQANGKSNFEEILEKGVEGWLIGEDADFLAGARKQRSISERVQLSSSVLQNRMAEMAQWADRFANVLVALNTNLLQQIEKGKQILADNGGDITKYSTDDKDVLTACVTLAEALSNAMRITVLNNDGDIPETTMKEIERLEALAKQKIASVDAVPLIEKE